MRILLVEPYYTGSHRTWADGYRDHSRHEVTLVTHEGRFWKWRMQGGFLTLAEEVNAQVARIGPPDVLLASDMVHLAGLLGACRESLAGVPVAAHCVPSHVSQVDSSTGGRGVVATRPADRWCDPKRGDDLPDRPELLLGAFGEGLGSLDDDRRGGCSKLGVLLIIAVVGLFPGWDVEDCVATAGRLLLSSTTLIEQGRKLSLKHPVQSHALPGAVTTLLDWDETPFTSGHG